MLFELRQYHIRPGQQEKWVKCMEEGDMIDREQIKVTRLTATPHSVIQ